jgi:multicomponent K+:H+ antiporter subunit E
MTRILPHPLLVAALTLMWLVLNSFSLGHLLLGTAVALVAGRAMAALEPVRPRVRRWDLALRLAVIVAVDILRSNVEVARLIAFGRRPGRRAGFVEIDLAISAPMALAALAVIVTSTPGTAWIDYDAARGRLLLHVIDLDDEDAWRATINGRYGRLLKEIFE